MRPPTSSHRTALLDAASGDGLTYGDLLVEADALGRILGRDRQLLLLLSRNDLFSVLAYATAHLEGHAIALVDGSRDAAIHAPIVEDYAPDWVLGPAGSGALLSAAAADVFDAMPFRGGELVRMTPSSRGLHPDLAVLLSTSGTTGSRKFVRLSRRNVDSNADAIRTALGIGEDERPVTSLPFHYTFGLSVLTSHLAAGATIVVTGDSVVQSSLWDTVRTQACTSIAGVPYTYQMLERIGYRDMDLPSLRTMQQAGGALDRSLTRAYADHMVAKGGRLFVMYGQTEATARMAYVPPERLFTHIGSAGIPIPGGRIRIDRHTVERVDGRRVGEVVYEGPNVMLGYATSRADLARGDDLGGVLRTGDLGYLDEDGFLYLVGRSKRIAKIFGLRVNLDEVERLLADHGPVAVVGGEDAIWAFCSFGTDGSLDSLAADLAKRMRLHRSSLRLRHVDDLPRSAAGKVDYREVERWTLT